MRSMYVFSLASYKCVVSEELTNNKTAGQTNLPSSCPVCEHSPLSADDCTPHKSLRTTIKVFLRTAEKKREASKPKKPVESVTTAPPKSVDPIVVVMTTSATTPSTAPTVAAPTSDTVDSNVGGNVTSKDVVEEKDNTTAPITADSVSHIAAQCTKCKLFSPTNGKFKTENRQLSEGNLDPTDGATTEAPRDGEDQNTQNQNGDDDGDGADEDENYGDEQSQFANGFAGNNNNNNNDMNQVQMMMAMQQGMGTMPFSGFPMMGKFYILLLVIVPAQQRIKTNRF